MIEVREALTNRERSLFASFANKLYADNPCWVHDLEYDVLDSLRPCNVADTRLFLAWRGDEVVGRVAGIINHRANKHWNVRYVRFGFLDFIDDTEVSKALLAAVEQWGREHHLTDIQGPMGVTDFDKEGMLVEDYDLMGDFVSYYNAPYYPRHLEALGFAKEADWLHIRIKVPEQLPKRFQRIVDVAPDMFGLRLVPMSKYKIFCKGYGKKFFYLVNEAYSPLFGFVKFSDSQINKFLWSYIPLIDSRLISMVENDKGEVVGGAVSMGSLSRTIRQIRGKLLPFGWMRLLRTIFLRPEETATMMLIAVRPDYQGTGVNALLFADQLKAFHAIGFDEAETGPQLEDNVKELSQWKLLDPTLLKRRRCFCKHI